MNDQKTLLQLIRIKKEHGELLLPLILVGLDLFIIALHFFHRYTGLLKSTLFNIGKEGGYAEFYQYFKYISVIILLIYIIRTTKCYNYIAWILVFVYFLCDDSLQFHEQVGFYFEKNFDFTPPFNLRLQDLGELSVYVAFGLFLLPILVWAYLVGSNTFKKVSIDMGIFVVALVFLGVFIDIAHEGISQRLWPIRDLFGIMEDGGEMVVLSLSLWYVFILAKRKGSPELYLHEELPKLFKKGS